MGENPSWGKRVYTDRDAPAQTRRYRRGRGMSGKKGEFPPWFTRGNRRAARECSGWRFHRVITAAIHIHDFVVPCCLGDDRRTYRQRRRDGKGRVEGRYG